jgi:hypothetical protein
MVERERERERESSLLSARSQKKVQDEHMARC